MYQIDHLLALLTDEKAKELQFRTGSSPMMISENEQHLLQGPPITDDEAMRLLRNLASSRQLRDLRERGATQFVYTTPGRTPFLIRASMEGQSVVFDVS